MPQKGSLLWLDLLSSDSIMVLRPLLHHHTMQPVTSRSPLQYPVVMPVPGLLLIGLNILGPPRKSGAVVTLMLTSTFTTIYWDGCIGGLNYCTQHVQYKTVPFICVCLNLAVYIRAVETLWYMGSL